MQLVVHDTPEATAHAIADRIAELSRESEDRFTLGLSGGSTPIPAYRILSGMTLDWERIDLWVSDERWVPPDHERSNGRMAAEVLAGPVGAWLYRPPWGEGMEPHEAAADYDGTIRNLMSGRRPDVIHLGVGDDGHTASLFPGTEAIFESQRLCVANPVPKLDATRLTFTPKLIDNAREVVFLVTGEGKAETLHKVLDGPIDIDTLPSQAIRPTHGRLRWLVDEAAAARLDKG